jgi:hypothetical protein
MSLTAAGLVELGSKPPAKQPKSADESKSDNPLTKIAYTIPEAVVVSGVSRSTLYLAIAYGDLRARKFGARTLILARELRRFLQALPHLEVRKVPAPARRRVGPGRSKEGAGPRLLAKPKGADQHELRTKK